MRTLELKNIFSKLNQIRIIKIIDYMQIYGLYIIQIYISGSKTGGPKGATDFVAFHAL